jgi:hypothetical protein
MIEGVKRWWNKWAKDPAPAPLRGAPAVRRMKNYAALSGYAYEYVYDGMRDLEGRREHVFTVSGDRKTWFSLSVFVLGAAIENWEQAHGRSLRENERYAVAKLALFAAFDERPNPAAMQTPIEVGPDEIGALLAQVGIE